MLANSDDLTAWLLSSQPDKVVARIISGQVSLAQVSPYQVSGGVNRSTIFFGREQLLGQILGRAPSNYLVVGGRQYFVHQSPPEPRPEVFAQRERRDRRARGAPGEFVQLPPYRDDGHGIFAGDPAAWRPKVEAILRGCCGLPGR